MVKLRIARQTKHDRYQFYSRIDAGHDLAPFRPPDVIPQTTQLEALFIVQENSQQFHPSVTVH